MKILSLTALALLFACSQGAQQQQAAPAGTVASKPVAEPESRAAVSYSQEYIDPKKFAIIIGGIGGDEEFAKKFASWTAELYSLLCGKLHFSEDNVFYLTATPDSIARKRMARSTAEEVKKAFEAVKAAANAGDLVFVFMVGHGSFDGERANFNLIGRDLSAKDYAALINSLPTSNVVFVNTSSASGEFIKPLSGKGHIVITATRSGNEQNSTIFAQFFIEAFKEQAADFDKNERVSMLEAFNYASRRTADWYKEQGRLATEHALIDDNGDGAGHQEATGGDGSLARIIYLDSRAASEITADAEMQKLLRERQRLELAVEELKTRKEQMSADAYEKELEKLLLDLAEVNQKIKARQK